MQQTVHQRVLERAAELLGGIEQLRAALGVPMGRLQSWMNGERRPPSQVFLKAVDIVSADPASGLPPAVRRSREVQRKADLVREASHEANERARRTHALASATLRHAESVRAELLRHALISARRRPVSATAFAAAHFERQDTAGMLESALNAALTGTSAVRANLQLVEPGGLRIVAQLGFDRPFLEYFSIVHAGIPSACGRASEVAQRVVVTDVATDPIFTGTEAGEVMDRAGARACQSTPLLSAAGALIGMLSTHYEEAHEPSVAELETVDLVSRRVAYWLDEAQA